MSEKYEIVVALESSYIVMRFRPWLGMKHAPLSHPFIMWVMGVVFYLFHTHQLCSLFLIFSPAFCWVEFFKTIGLILIQNRWWLAVGNCLCCIGGEKRYYIVLNAFISLPLHTFLSSFLTLPCLQVFTFVCPPTVYIRLYCPCVSFIMMILILLSRSK